MNDQEAVFSNGFTDNSEVEVPFVEDGFRFGLFLGLQHHEHPLLTFGEHHLVCRHGVLANWYEIEVQANAEAAFVTHFNSRTRQTCCPHVLDRNDRTGRHQFQSGFEQAFFREGIANLDSWAFLFDCVVEFRGRHCRAANTVTARLCAEVNDWHADAGSC